jgi:hypothetical protein
MEIEPDLFETYNKSQMDIKYPEIGICGLSCRLCPSYQTEAASKCNGCKSSERMTVGCPFITCAIKKVGVEFCWDCGKSGSCEKWMKHRELGQKYDSFKSYQKLEADINLIKAKGIREFEDLQKIRESLLKRFLKDFNEGRSKSYYCIAATVMDIEELESSLAEAGASSNTLSIKEKSRIMHSILDSIAMKKGYRLSLRK